MIVAVALHRYCLWLKLDQKLIHFNEIKFKESLCMLDVFFCLFLTVSLSNISLVSNYMFLRVLAVSHEGKWCG